MMRAGLRASVASGRTYNTRFVREPKAKDAVSSEITGDPDRLYYTTPDRAGGALTGKECERVGRDETTGSRDTTPEGLVATTARY